MLENVKIVKFPKDLADKLQLLNLSEVPKYSQYYQNKKGV